MQRRMNAEQFWVRRRVLVTGHTGFKGGWLALWLNTLGAEVRGLALEPSRPHSFFEATRLSSLVQHRIVDIRDLRALTAEVDQFQPHVIFHLAAQAFVSESYAAPVDTYATNVMGTVNLLEATRSCRNLQAIVNVTTDKCYQNTGTTRPYRETDPLGGSDPYSSSKACAELVSNAYRASFLVQRGVALATARAGNVIGGGDWSKDRLVPETLTSLAQGTPLTLRKPEAVRPWQHVLEPVSGYLKLARRLIEAPGGCPTAFNFGPRESDCLPVGQVVSELQQIWGGPTSPWASRSVDWHEADLLRLDSSLARELLGWRPRWNLRDAIRQTVGWYRAWLSGADMLKVSMTHIEEYECQQADLAEPCH